MAIGKKTLEKLRERHWSNFEEIKSYYLSNGYNPVIALGKNIEAIVAIESMQRESGEKIKAKKGRSLSALKSTLSEAFEKVQWNRFDKTDKIIAESGLTLAIKAVENEEKARKNTP